MGPSQELIDDIYRARVRRAREMTPEEKFLAGPRLFEEACDQLRAAIRLFCPYADEQALQEMVFHTLDFIRQREEAGRYFPILSEPEA